MRTTDFGLKPQSLKMIQEALAQFPQIQEALIIGSRAMGHYKRGSDIDIALKGSNITETILAKIKGKLEDELPLPYLFDVIHYETIKNLELKKHIDTYGKSIIIS